MRTDKEALKFAGTILLKCMLVGLLFVGVAYFLKHATPTILFVVFAVPVAIGAILAGVVLSSPKPLTSKPDAAKPNSQQG